MNRQILFAFLLGLLLSGGIARAAHLADPGRLLPADGVWAKAAETELTAFEHTTGIRILVEFHLKSPATDEDKVPGAYMSALSRKLGTLQRGVLIVYFADDPDWRVWIGDELTATFVGKPGTVQELTASGAIHDVKEAMLTAARAKADATFAEVQKSAPADQPPTPAQHLVLQTDALLDALTGRLRTK